MSLLDTIKSLPIPSRVGFDIGGVIYPKDNNVLWTGEEIFPNKEIIDAITYLHEQKSELFIISYCGRKRIESSMSFLEKFKVVPDLIPLDHVYFHSDDKRAKVVVAKYLKLDLFVDDSPDVIKYLSTGLTPSDKKMRKKWLKIKGQIGKGPWKRMPELIPEWESYFEGGLNGKGVLWRKGH